MLQFRIALKSAERVIENFFLFNVFTASLLPLSARMARESAQFDAFQIRHVGPIGCLQLAKGYHSKCNSQIPHQACNGPLASALGCIDIQVSDAARDGFRLWQGEKTAVVRRGMAPPQGVFNDARGKIRRVLQELGGKSPTSASRNLERIATCHRSGFWN
ncbi:hypothetical protein [Salaquimonas pukyongi]|uniref:hypothetical protein n=1 Tax=Salaquimonas pukyongi TaxID=2712698 RepID=UPI0012EC3A24|nr:hypothetical protein [Salaquimonas pukyongi]